MSCHAQDAVRVAAIDLGASSGRVVVGQGTARGFALREVHRFANQPRTAGGVLRWDARALFGGILAGLRAAGREDGPLDAVAVDGWGVDYGLLDGAGVLIADPANYLDSRTGPSYAAVIETADGVGGVAAGLGLARPPQVVIGPSHDTAAAVAGVPAAGEAFAFVCTGTWTLAGVELPAPVITAAGRQADFTNEVGIDGTIRFLRNVTGFWLLQECVREWEAQGRPVDLDELTEAAGHVPGRRALIDVQDPGFAAPGTMTERIIRACLRTSGVTLSAEAEILRCILDSMAIAIRHAVRDAVRVTGRAVRTVHVVGGGVANPLFCQLTADACGLPVVAGPTEAASWGNVLVQARALGVAGGSLPELRSLVQRGTRLARYQPTEQEAAWARADEIVLASRP